MADYDPNQTPPSFDGTSRQELVTATGWRVVGSAADHVSDPKGLTASAALSSGDILIFGDTSPWRVAGNDISSKRVAETHYRKHVLKQAIATSRVLAEQDGPFLPL